MMSVFQMSVFQLSKVIPLTHISRPLSKALVNQQQATRRVIPTSKFRRISSEAASRNASRITSIFTKEAVPPIGPYSQAIKAQGLVWVSGQIAANNKGELITGSVAEKTHRICKNARAVLEAAGSGLEKVVKVTVFFTDFNDFNDFNKVYAEYFPHKPARSSLEASRLPAGVTVEMELVAIE